MAGFPTNSIIFKYNLKIANMAIIDTWTKEQFLQCISDLYKEAFGVRPRGINYSEWSVEELRTEWKRLEKLAIDEFWYNEQ